MPHYNCFDPWKGMIVAFSGNIAVQCCHQMYSGQFWDQKEPLDIMEYWNNDWFQNLRAIFNGNNLVNTQCERCAQGILGSNSSIEIPKGLNSFQLDNYRKAIKNFQGKESVVDHYPVDYLFDFGRACDLDCIMCTQKEVRGFSSKERLPSKRLEAQADVLSHASSIMFFGGEPLIIKESLKFLEFMVTDPRLNNVEISMVTNGMHLDKIMDLIRNSPRLNVIISLDSIGEAYEHIRRGANWGKVSRNIDALLMLKKDHPLWKVNINSVLMKTSMTFLMTARSMSSI